MTIDVFFNDSGRTATDKPDPKYPEGKPINLTTNVFEAQCTRNLPYPAPRCGTYAVVCCECGYKAILTVAGRIDDPNRVTLPCKRKPH